MYESHACTFIANRICNNIPAVAGFSGEVNYVENAAAELLSPAIALTFGSTLESARVSLIGANGNDRLEAAPGSGITAAYNGNTQVLTLAGTATVSAYETALKTIRFATVGEMIDLHSQRTVGAILTVCHMPSVCSVVQSQSVVVIPKNDHPLVAGVGGSYIFSQDGESVAIAEDAVLTDLDHTRLDSATITIAAPHHTGDVLTATAPAGITAAWHGGSGSLTLTGSASVAVYQQAIRTVTFHNAVSLLSVAPRAISVAVSDGIHSSSSVPQIAVTIHAKTGFFSDPQTGAVTACPRGKYQPTVGTVLCIGCDVGMYGGDVATNPVTSESHCLACNPGTFQDHIAQTGCPACAAGKFGSGSQVAASYCKACAIGQFSGSTARTECTACAPGYYAGEQGMVACILCSACTVGEYFTGCQHGSDNSICAICAAGKFSVCPEAVSGAKCHKELACTSCAAGRFGDVTRERTSADHCAACAAGRAQHDTATTTCSGCSAGKFAPDTGMIACTACELGQYQPSAAQDFCFACAAGKFGQPGHAQTTQDYCKDCAHGQYQTASGVHGECTACAAGHFQDIEVAKTTASHCVACAPGHYQDKIAFVQECKICAPLSFQSASMSVQCETCSSLACPDGQFVSQTCAPEAREADRVCSQNPAVSGVSGGIYYGENTAPVLLTPAAAVIFGFNLDSATIALVGANGNDRLAYKGSTPGITATFGAASKALTLSGIASASDYQEALQNVEFRTLGEMIDVHSQRTVHADVTVCHVPAELASAVLLGNDGACSVAQRVAVTITPVNDVSSVAVADKTVQYTHGSRVPVAPAATLTDPDHTNLARATLRIAAPHHAGDVLTPNLTGIAGITSSWTAATETLILEGAASVALYQQVIRTVTFHSTSTVLSTTSRSISIMLYDGISSSSSEPLVSVPICAAAGFFADAAKEMVVACPNGKYQTASCRTACTECAAGKFGDEPSTAATADHCQQCAVGQYQTAAASTECLECTKGQYGPGSGEHQAQASYCTKCAAGQAQRVRGMGSCTDCVMGRFAPGEEAIVCKGCPAGRFQPAEGRTSCTACEAGKSNKVSAQSSASACISCAVGSYAPTEGHAECLPWSACSPGTFNKSPSTVARGQCTVCPAGKFQPAETAVAEPCADWAECVPGKYIVDHTAVFGGTCLMCAAGQYREAAAHTASGTVPRTHREAGAHTVSGCSLCKAGRYTGGEGSTVEAACVQCAAGTYANENGAAACKDCADDTFGLLGATECKTCDYGGWHDWGQCDKSCETGHSVRHRVVETVAPEAHDQCVDTQKRECNKRPCPHRVKCKHVHCRYRSDDGKKFIVQVYHHHKDSPAVHHCKLYNAANGATVCHCHCWSSALPARTLVRPHGDPTLPWTSAAIRGHSQSQN
jgi:hypothetical protein